MGRGYIIKCENCEHEETILFGVGPNGYSNINRAFSNLDYKRRNKIKQIINTYPNSKNLGAHVIMQCNKCNRIFGRYYIRIFQEETIHYETKYACPACKSRDIKMFLIKLKITNVLNVNKQPSPSSLNYSGIKCFLYNKNKKKLNNYKNKSVRNNVFKF